MAYSRPAALLLLVFGLLWHTPGLWPEEAELSAEGADPAALIGLGLGDLFARYGIPRSVHAARGVEPWQDDVVFVYAAGDFYLYRDRVWQLGLRAAYGVKTGDSRGLIPLLLGEGVEEFDDHLLCPLFGWSWPLVLRFNLNDSGQVSAIYIYRSDF